MFPDFFLDFSHTTASNSFRCHDVATAIEQPNRCVERCRTQMHVALSHAELAVSGKLLNRPSGGSTHRQVRTERMPKDVDTVRMLLAPEMLLYEHSVRNDGAKDAFEYSRYLSRAAGRLSEVLFKG